MKTFKSENFPYCLCKTSLVKYDNMIIGRTEMCCDGELHPGRLTKDDMRYPEAIKFNYSSSLWDSPEFTNKEHPLRCPLCKTYKWTIVPNPYYNK